MAASGHSGYGLSLSVLYFPFVKRPPSAPNAGSIAIASNGAKAIENGILCTLNAIRREPSGLIRSSEEEKCDI
jgi:hypothetical protein